ncbi:GRAS family protein [Leptothoe spongobia]|uniref:Methyltransferase domain-containing protein n=1 Tax=Leptothoe spongobia TAU-MAC 1115 TaxID=1967444 RepID=A0A947GI10_9CYAN|nr:GRAS family protein [Leptothoe spongobia]MBT9315820.1 methyltransferase domain-containing protein [Leptothoe spongobia TAU-MAC 1115]
MDPNRKKQTLTTGVRLGMLLENSLIEPTPITSHTQASCNQAQLFNIVDLIAQQRMQTAQQQLNQLLDTINSSTDSDAITHLIFARALAEHLSDEVADKANLYLKPYEIPQIQLFNLLANQVPLVSLISQLAIGLLIDACDGRDEITLVDIGIGTGRQMVALLHQLANRARRLQRIHIIGIEPSEESLSLAKQAIATAAQQLELEVTFTEFCNGIENLDNQDWQHLRDRCDSPIINASFALHHIRDQAGQDVRTVMLQRLHQLNPTLIVLAEPNTDHLESDFRIRFQNCWRHYSNVFKMIDALAIDQQSKAGLKTCFFGREVVDVLKADNTARIERHETAQSWVNRLKQSGYTLKLPYIDDLFNSSIFTIQTHADHYLNFDYNGVPLVSLICAHA